MHLKERCLKGIKMNDRDYMLRAIELAKKGAGFTNPNPLVGAVIVKDNRIIGEGYHQKYGELHAERNAIASLKESAKGATIYVTLEPCCHYGKTPPCTEAIISAEISKVVIGSRDPNPKVSGKGAQILREAGIEVVEDFLRDECDKLNDIFFHYITTKTPYVVMKYAMTADGKIATKTGASKWITGEESRALVQKMRHRYAGIMVGIGTVLADNPMLNTRVEGLTSPTRIIVDTNLRTPLDANVVTTANEYATIIAYNNGDEDKIKQLEQSDVTLVKCPLADNHVDLKYLMKEIGERGIDSILLEGGGTLNESALGSGIVNKLFVFVAPQIFGGEKSMSPVRGEGVDTPAESVKLKLVGVKQIDEDLLIEYNVR